MLSVSIEVSYLIAALRMDAIVDDRRLHVELRTIASFQVDHRKMGRGMFVSRRDGDITTYDIRMKKPNAEAVLENAALHTIEHLFATYARSSELSDHVVYVGPMGCRTGFYLLLRDLPPADAMALARRSFAFIAAFEGPVPGASLPECGNWRDHDLAGAKAEAKEYLRVLENWGPADLEYPS
jgi:S-ribosylhomocysteine lyase